MYLAPVIGKLSLIGGHGLMLPIGVIEIAAGTSGPFKPRIEAYVVSAWLLGIVISLLVVPGFFDIAMRDFGLSLSAFALGRLSRELSS